MGITKTTRRVLDSGRKATSGRSNKAKASLRAEARKILGGL